MESPLLKARLHLRKNLFRKKTSWGDIRDGVSIQIKEEVMESNEYGEDVSVI